MSWTRPWCGLDWSHSLFYLTLLLWTRRMNGLADFSNYLSRIITSHSAHACDGAPLRLHCPRHSTISIQSAFYGSGRVRLCSEDPQSGPQNQSCSALTALQKLLSECQNHRDCQLPVTHLLFGKDPCPGKTKYLHVDYKCKPSEHKTQVVCEGEIMFLRCKPPKALIIYAAVYGRGLGQTDACPSLRTRPPPFECLNHEAVQVVSKSCYSRQKCAVAVGNQTFRDPCFPGTRKYLSVLYSCVPKSLLREADPSILSTTSLPSTEKDSVSDLESSRPDSSGAMMSNSLLTYAFIKEHPETAALLFTSSVCIGLLFTLLALSVQVTCRGRRLRDHWLAAKSNGVSPNCSEQYYEDKAQEDGDNEGTESFLLSTAERRGIQSWEEVTYMSEAAELAERIERRDMIIQEIWMNSYLNGSSC
ncbi:PREDICTED: protein eva-1 homolog C isoform X1 [Cyprinodon variegatus]|uniref:Eva-1 homolog C (C. elegans) n=1 Tax=Cyprinodon variegatus TaxID=28743 RepID=A0A3Q2DBJ9_CYPVA|nr:PREDICTED: protein eva-1 homolog C isoform X1 [Cyprinodon variegatus]